MQHVLLGRSAMAARAWGGTSWIPVVAARARSYAMVPRAKRPRGSEQDSTEPAIHESGSTSDGAQHTSEVRCDNAKEKTTAEDSKQLPRKCGGFATGSGRLESSSPGKITASPKKSKRRKTPAGQASTKVRPDQWQGLVVVGLGNPGARYDRTRHNVGFLVLDEIARLQGLPFAKVKGTQADAVRWREEERLRVETLKADQRRVTEVHLIKPQTMMNLSGDAVSRYLRYVRKQTSGVVDRANVLVVADDSSLDFGRLRLKLGGSAGGHNGLKHIQQKLGSDQYHRLKVGIGNAQPGGMVGHVLGQWSPEEKASLSLLRSNVARAIRLYIEEPNTERAMTLINDRRSEYHTKAGDTLQ